ncbi:MAG TPA: sugar transferase [Aeromicrobium sp.]|nr:sugar transferase [Aeromicrobium sp.]
MVQELSELRFDVDPTSLFAPSLPEPLVREVSKHRIRQRRLGRLVLASDAIVIGLAITIAHLTRYIILPVPVWFDPGAWYSLSVSVGLFVFWMFALWAGRSRDPKVLESGPRQYQAVLRSSFHVFGWIAIVTLVLQLRPSRMFICIAGILGVVLLLLSRRAWRNWVLRRRQHGRYLAKALVIGGVRSAQDMTQRFLANPGHGIKVAGVWVPDRVAGRQESMQVGASSVPIMGTESNLDVALAVDEIDTVVVTDTEHLGHDGMRELAWALEGRGVDLLVAPNVVDVAGPRVHLDAHSNMPLIYLSGPTYSRAKTVGRAVFDRTFAALVLVGTFPILLAAAIVIKATSRGPVFYRSVRIGAHGVPFEIYKLRTMVADAEGRRDELMPFNIGSGPLFKMPDDPRVTPVGGFLRKYSIDELPQFINVLKGDMSVVGPRPLLPGDLDDSGEFGKRRLLVKQGVTGLWQVSGRSDLSWEDSVRLDLDYVENWSMIRDLQIIVQTLRVVLQRHGAY